MKTYTKGENITINLSVQKGTRTWCGKVKNQELELEFIDGYWGKEKGSLEFQANEPGYYIANDYISRDFWYVYQNDKNQLVKIKTTKNEIIRSFASERLISSIKARDFIFATITAGPKNTAWEAKFTPIGEVLFGENEHYYVISGKFKKKFTLYARNFTTFIYPNRTNRMGFRKRV